MKSFGFPKYKSLILAKSKTITAEKMKRVYTHTSAHVLYGRARKSTKKKKKKKDKRVEYFC